MQFQTFAVNDESSITEQLDKAQSALNQGCTALLASPISATALDSVFTAALAKGVPAIVLNDAKGTVPGVVYVGPDAEAIGETAADYIAEQLPGGGKVAMIEGDPGSSNALNRGKGFKEGLAKHPNLEPGRLPDGEVGHQPGADHRDGHADRQPRHQGVLLPERHDGVRRPGRDRREGPDRQVIIVGTDGIPQAKKQIADGDLSPRRSASGPPPKAPPGVKTALWLLDGKNVPGWVDVPAFIVDKTNVADYPTGMP